ncbi:gliding motility-associated C-terminal domain-containing protein, partial [Cytophagaceae bacterium YF14B1]
IGEIVRDMQITVREQPNKRPELIIPKDTCIVAGTVLKAIIRATDPDQNQSIRISSESAIFSTSTALFPHQPAATLDPPNHPPKVRDQYQYQGNPAQSNFEWKTVCTQVRAQPYDVVFKAEDNAPVPNQLTDTKTWRITVVGPPVTGLKPTVEANAIRLSWNPYTCSGATQLLIWRKQGCSPDQIDPCAKSIPAGYTLVGRVAATSTSFLDQTVKKGIQYAYRVSAAFTGTSGGAGILSDQVCARLKLTVPIITNVSVSKTDLAQGQIKVRWAQPLEIDPAEIPGPYRYQVFRATGFSTSFGSTPVYTTEWQPSIPAPTSYLSFTDSGLNTEVNPYTYVVVLLSSNGARADSSQPASSVRLSATPLPDAIQLKWTAQVPWDNTNSTHIVYREDQTKKNQVPKAYVKLAEVPVSSAASFTYIDTGNGIKLNKDSLYCYYVETVGTYNERLLEDPLINASQELCSSPLDTVKPCAVVLAIDPTPCAQWASEEGSPSPSFCSVSTYSNHLSWVYPQTEGDKECDQDLSRYRIYYKRYEEDREFTLIDSVWSPVQVYNHINLTSFAGCYYVTVVDRSGNESAPSNIVCQDNCPYYALPNVITPDNGDTLNQVFEPYPCPRFIESGKITILNRWGRKVFETSDIHINWAGGLNNNAEVSDANNVSPGVYYYSAELKTMRLRRRDERIVIKGWVHILK